MNERMDKNEGISSEGTSIKLRVPVDFKTRIEAAAAERHVSVSALVRLAMVEYLKAQEVTA